MPEIWHSGAGKGANRFGRSRDLAKKEMPTHCGFINQVQKKLSRIAVFMLTEYHSAFKQRTLE